MLLDGRTDFAVKIDLLLQRGTLRIGVPRLGKVLGDVGVGTHEGSHRLVKRDA